MAGSIPQQIPMIQEDANGHKPGDLVLYPVYPHSKLISKMIGISEIVGNMGDSDIIFSHCAIYVGDGWEIEAHFPMSARFPVRWERRPIIRAIPGISDNQRLQIVHTAEHKIGEWYDIVGLVSFGFISLPHSELCGAFIESCLTPAGIKIPREEKRLLTPNAIGDYLKIGEFK